jgi:dihydrofolate reductase
MSKLVAGITTSVDGYIAGPDDAPGRGLGVGGERLHHWVFGGPWTYDDPPTHGPTGEDKAWLDAVNAGIGAVIAGRGTYENSSHWGGQNPFHVPMIVVTHRPDDQPDPAQGFWFVGDLGTAVREATSLAGDFDVHVMGGAELIRGLLAEHWIDELTVIVAPVVLGGGKRLFDGFERALELRHLGVRQSPYATFIDYGVVGPAD